MDKCSIPPALPTRAAPQADAIMRFPVITDEGWILDGEDCVEDAKQRTEATIQCVVYELSKSESVGFLLSQHRKRSFLNDYCRIILALLLEEHLRNLLREGKTESQASCPSMLTIGDRDVRKVIARIASVSTGNVSKTRFIRDNGIDRLQEELKAGTRSIHSGYLIAHLSSDEQDRRLASNTAELSPRRIDRLINAVRPRSVAVQEFLDSMRDSLAILATKGAYEQVCDQLKEILAIIEANFGQTEND